MVASLYCVWELIWELIAFLLPVRGSDYTWTSQQIVERNGGNMSVPEANKSNKKWYLKKGFLITTGVILLMIIIAAIGSSNSDSDLSAKSTEASEVETVEETTPIPEVPKVKTWGPGTFLVGTEIPPGVYRTNDYWSVNSADGEIIDNDLIRSGTTIAVIPEGAATVKFSGEAMAIADSAVYDPIVEGFTEGTYVVGVDIQPGQYRVSGSSAYAARLDGNLEIIDNDLSDGSVILMVDPSDAYFKFSGTLEKIG